MDQKLQCKTIKSFYHHCTCILCLMDSFNIMLQLLLIFSMHITSRYYHHHFMHGSCLTLNLNKIVHRVKIKAQVGAV